MKKHINRPALRAIDIARWVNKNILKTIRVKQTSILYLPNSKTVRQYWFRRFRGKIVKRTATTYLSKGIFLVPRWRKVPKWEIEYFKEQNINFASQAILMFDNVFHQLIFMQIEDLDHALRQQDHVIDNYLDTDFLESHLKELVSVLYRQERIIQKIGIRKISVGNLQMTLQRELRSFHKSIRSILQYAPIFMGKDQDRSKTAIKSVLKKIIKECRSYPFRPVGRRLGYAAKSLELAIIHLENDRLDLAKARLKSALKNLEYPSS